MPPTEEMINKAIACMGETTLVRFAADRTSIRAGETVTISWEVDKPDNCQLSTTLNHSQVPRTGSRTIRPVRFVSYRLDVRAAGVSKLLGVVNVDVDASGCTAVAIPEDLVRPEVLTSVDESLAEYNLDPKNKDNPVTKRRETVFEIEPSGMVVRLRLKLGINNFFDPDIDIDARIAIGMSPEGDVLAFFKSFEVDVDWPWWVTGITLGITKLVEEYMDGEIEKKMKPKVINDLRASFRRRLNDLPGTVASLETGQDEVLATVCQTGVNPIGHIVRPIGHDLVITRG